MSSVCRVCIYRIKKIRFSIAAADYQTGAKTEAESTTIGLQGSASTAIVPPVELTHLFLNKDGTLDSSRLFRDELSLRKD